MFRSSDFNKTLSMKLSEVMDDIGISEEYVIRKRRVFMLIENVYTVKNRSIGMRENSYFLGSQSEGTTTKGLNSDFDILQLKSDGNVMQDWSDWKQYKHNYLMIQDENVTPGYCFLQLVRPDVPLPATYIPTDNHIRDSSGRILWRNTLLIGLREGAVRQGPSNTVPGINGCPDMDLVLAFPCNSWPRSASASIGRQGRTKWPSPEIIRYATSNCCFVVGANSKISAHPDLEWRISTSLAERCLMYNLNITQLQCYVLLKIILKTFLNPQKENGMSSFICKTVLFHCIEKSENCVWKMNNITTCLTYCLLQLRSYLQNNICPHFMIPTNNLMAGQFTVKGKRDLLERISDVLQSDSNYLLQIHIDDIGHRLLIKLNTSCICHTHMFPRPCFCGLPVRLVEFISDSTLAMYSSLLDIDDIGGQFSQTICNLTNYSLNGNRFEQLASLYQLPFLCSTFGSFLASSCIRQNIPISPKALTWLYLGLNSDVTSGRLKLASVFYCTGDMNKAEFILRQTESKCHSETLIPLCGCYSKGWKSQFNGNCRELHEDSIKHFTLFCVRFLPIELNCIPKELRHEMKRSTREDMEYRRRSERKWMYFAVIDSLPFLYFLQYKTYNNLHRYRDKHQALRNLAMCIVTGVNFGHRETALNLLGQCMEQENKPKEALHCYMLSLKERARNNAAKFHICSLLSKYARHNVM